MSKRTVFTTVTPIPPGISRQTVLDFLHSHLDMIDLNPLVIDRQPCNAPAFASTEESYCSWYLLKDKISYLPGGLATGAVEYYACFHQIPSGLQTHVFAPLGVNIKGKWTVGGSLPGEPKQPTELGIGAPREGLYLREDVNLKCNVIMASFIKKTLKKSHAKLVQQLAKKARDAEQLTSTKTPAISTGATGAIGEPKMQSLLPSHATELHHGENSGYGVGDPAYKNDHRNSTPPKDVHGQSQPVYKQLSHGNAKDPAERGLYLSHPQTYQPYRRPPVIPASHSIAPSSFPPASTTTHTHSFTSSPTGPNPSLPPQGLAEMEG